MADGFRVEFEGDDAARVEAAARQCGMSVEAYVRTAALTAAYDETNPSEIRADRLEIERRWSRFQKSGVTTDHAEVLDVLRSRARGSAAP